MEKDGSLQQTEEGDGSVDGKRIERFVGQLHIISQKIMEEYKERVASVISNWKKNEEQEEGKANKEDDRNDFRVDRDRIRAAHYLEENNQRLCFDPDNDGFNFGYEMALTFKVRFNMFRLIRKEILS